MNQSHEIDVDIDAITNCLTEKSTGKIIPTEYHLITKRNTAKAARELIQSGWRFDWSIPQKNGFHVIQLSLKICILILSGPIASFKGIFPKRFRMIQKRSSDSFDQFGSAMKDGRLTEPSNGKNFDLHKAIDLSKELGRPLNENEIAQFAV